MTVGELCEGGQGWGRASSGDVCHAVWNSAQAAGSWSGKSCRGSAYARTTHPCCPLLVLLVLGSCLSICLGLGRGGSSSLLHDSLAGWQQVTNLLSVHPQLCTIHPAIIAVSAEGFLPDPGPQPGSKPQHSSAPTHALDTHQAIHPIMHTCQHTCPQVFVC